MTTPAVLAARPSRNLVGAGWMLASAVTFVTMMTLVKFLGSTYSTPLQTFYRQLAMFVILLPLMIRRGRAAFATDRPWIMMVRSAVTVAAMMLSFYSYNELTLVTANTLSFTRSLWLAPLAVLMLHERLGVFRAGALAIGFLGVLVMMGSSASGFLDPAALAGLAAAAMFAVTVTTMKSLMRNHTVTVVVCWSAVLGLVFSFPIALFSWRWPTPQDAGLIAIMGVLAVVNQSCYAKGMQAGDALVMAPIDYTRLIFATVFGFVIFHEPVQLSAYAGAALIVGSSVVVTWREYILGRRANRATASADGARQAAAELPEEQMPLVTAIAEPRGWERRSDP